METDDCCPICIEDYSYKNNIIKNSCKTYGIISDCKHCFCTLCIEKLYNKNMYDCPLCRTDITELIYYSIKVNHNHIDKVKNYDNENTQDINKLFNDFEHIFNIKISEIHEDYTYNVDYDPNEGLKNNALNFLKYEDLNNIDSIDNNLSDVNYYSDIDENENEYENDNIYSDKYSDIYASIYQRSSESNSEYNSDLELFI